MNFNFFADSSTIRLVILMLMVRFHSWIKYYEYLINIVGKLAIKQTSLHFIFQQNVYKTEYQVSRYRRNRNYTKHFEWTYELNRDVYRCYTQARGDPRIGYMKRLKK